MEIKQHAVQQLMSQRKNQGIKKIPWDKWKWKHDSSKFTGHNNSSSKREIHCDTGLFQETGKIPNEQSKFIPNLEKETRKWKANKAQSCEKEVNQKDQSGNKERF